MKPELGDVDSHVSRAPRPETLDQVNPLQESVPCLFVTHQPLVITFCCPVPSFLYQHRSQYLCLQDEERIDPDLETMLEAGVDEMSWDSVVRFS